MQIKWTPPCCETIEDINRKGEKVETEKKFRGSLELKIPSFPERTRIKRECMGNDMATRPIRGAEINAADAYEMVEKAAEVSKKYVVKVDVEHIESKKKAVTIDQLYEDPTFEDVCTELAGFYSNGCAPSAK